MPKNPTQHLSFCRFRQMANVGGKSLLKKLSTKHAKENVAQINKKNYHPKKWLPFKKLFTKHAIFFFLKQDKDVHTRDENALGSITTTRLCLSDVRCSPRWPFWSWSSSSSAAVPRRDRSRSSMLSVTSCMHAWRRDMCLVQHVTCISGPNRENCDTSAKVGKGNLKSY